MFVKLVKYGHFFIELLKQTYYVIYKEQKATAPNNKIILKSITNLFQVSRESLLRIFEHLMSAQETSPWHCSQIEGILVMSTMVNGNKIHIQTFILSLRFCTP